MTDNIIYNTTYAKPMSFLVAEKSSGMGILDLLIGVPNPTGIEIGCDVGENASYWLKRRQDMFLFCVDPYLTYTDWNGNYLNDRDVVYNKFIETMNPYVERYELLKMKSDDAVSKFEDNSLDFVFIDGLHEYEQTSRDCRNYWPKLKIGGVFAGHDYKTIQGVNDAVNEFAAEVNAKVLTTVNDVWYWIKTGE